MYKGKLLMNLPPKENPLLVVSNSGVASGVENKEGCPFRLARKKPDYVFILVRSTE
jgi:hypothetical protein